MRSRPIAGYLLAGLAGLAALLLWLAIGRPVGATPYLFFLGAVMGTSWRYGLRPGIVVMALAALASAYFYIPPTHNLAPGDVRGVLHLGLFLMVAFGVAWLNERRIQTERDLRHAGAQTSQALERISDAERRFSFLAEAGAVLASSLDYEATLASVARLAVPQIGDWCAVHVVGEDGEVRQLAATHVDPARVQLARDLEHRLPYDPDAPGGVPEVLRTGKSEVIPEITDEMLEAALPSEELLAIFRGLGLRSSMIVPLVARGHTLGTITLIAAESGRRYGPDDVALAEELAARAAVAVDNARLYREAQRVGAERSAILAQMADGVVIVDPDGVVVFANNAARSMVGGQFLGDSLTSAVGSLHVTTLDGQPYSVEQLPLARALRERAAIVDAEWRLSRADGVDMIMQGSAAPLLAENGALLGAVSTFRDVTEQHALARQKDDFLSAAAHDLKTPLTSIKGLAQILRRRVDGMSSNELRPVLDGLTQIDAAATRMTRLINELLDVSRVQMDRPLPLKKEPTDLVDLVGTVVDDLQRTAHGHRIVLETEAPRLIGRWDGERLERVFGNLITNALKYSPPGSEVIVSIALDPDREPGSALVTVEDHGIGIPEADLPRIFERFYRARNVEGRIPGTGIGLVGAKQIIDQHDGTIQIESWENLGTRVTVRLPATPVVAAPDLMPAGE